jgi:hypothetical protein
VTIVSVTVVYWLALERGDRSYEYRQTEEAILYHMHINT